MTMAYKRSDSKKIDGRRILVDVERGRYVSLSVRSSVACIYMNVSLYVFV